LFKEYKNSAFKIMAKVKYYYDADTLSYRKIKHEKKDVFRKSTFAVLAVFLVAFFGFIGFSQFLMSPNERTQEREFDNLKLHYELLSKRIEESSKVLNELQERDNTIYRVYFEANPIPEEQRKAGFGGVNRYKDLEGFDNSAMIKKATKELDVLSKQMVVQSKSLDEIVKLAKDKEEMLSSIPAIQPVSNENLKRMASGFGYRVHPIYKTRKYHWGMDFSAPKGTPVYATGNGVIIKALRSRKGLGNYVKINHGYGYVTVYGHMSKFVVRKNQKVKRGDLIGYVGSSGTSTAPHLHYEVQKGNIKVNPVYYYFNDLTPEEYDRMLELASLENQSLD
jgi:murein DD-endopeptidase MepM/ murein hydrolase activator NlpD